MQRLPSIARAEALVMRVTALLVVAALVMRVLVGPALAQPPSDGMVQLCLGGQVVWVSMDGDAPIEVEADPCPWFALATPPEIPSTELAGTAPIQGVDHGVHLYALSVRPVSYRRQNPRGPPSA